ncbi:uncharacterized protein [Parasteatoda tepidariorum]|uniref:uncharacterized protein isoform X2 n=1 Tax=Parasteatoda tepidariorum TaxID=114398 RepID=UPI001C71C0E5|nr:uncharacterized protein LOC122269420 isoform X1 [Parasteatoda tepidariorum]
MTLIIYSIAFLIAIISQNSDATDVFEFQDCSNGKGIANFSNLSVNPHPIPLSDIINISADITLHQDIPDGAVIKTNLYKVTSLFGFTINIPILCIGGYGSCSTEHCEYLNTMEIVCPFFPGDEKCGCPVKANRYRGYNVPVRIPEIGSILKALARGHFKYELRIVTKEKAKELICISITGKIV